MNSVLLHNGCRDVLMKSEISQITRLVQLIAEFLRKVTIIAPMLIFHLGEIDFGLYLRCGT
jgi:hypothetical protein